MRYGYSDNKTYSGYRRNQGENITTQELYELILNMKLDNDDFYDEAVDGRVLKRQSVSADHLELHSITVDFLNVDYLSAISADLGIVEAGELTGVNIYGSRFETLDDDTGANITLEGGAFSSSYMEVDENNYITQKDTIINQGSITQLDLGTSEEAIQTIYMSFYEPGKLELSYETNDVVNTFKIYLNETMSIIETTSPLTINGISLEDLETRIAELEAWRNEV